MEIMTCKTCGGNLSRNGNYYVCKYCGNKWEIDISNDIHVVDRANAWSALRDGDFEKAAELFENIILKDAQNHEAYWGRALAVGGIVYVVDTNESKRVPTCNNITETSFVQQKDVQKAISLSPDDIAQEYKKQAEYIEQIRVEWLKKASKEPPYDIFLSFKDSDDNKQRTQDSIDAQDLYQGLVDEGYRVFFSRISLRNKISERYEPYIYNAIKTAKVMIVFGEKPEYFNSVWIKNEWTRFRKRIEQGEKHKNSLVVVYKNMDPSELPVSLKSRQCINASDMTFFADLVRHINRIVSPTNSAPDAPFMASTPASTQQGQIQLNRIKIEGGQIAPKATSLSGNTIKTKKIGQGAVAETSLSEQQSISLIRTYLTEHQWHEAGTLASNLLSNNSYNAEAMWYKLLAKHQSQNNEMLAKELNKFKSDDLQVIDKVLNCSSANFAQGILTSLYQYGGSSDVSDVAYAKILKIILSYDFEQRDARIKSAISDVITHSKYTSFKLLLTTLKSDEVDTYVYHNYRYAVVKTASIADRLECLENILKVDAGHVNALRTRFELHLTHFAELPIKCPPVNLFKKDLEALLKYTESINTEVIKSLNWMCLNLSTPEHCEFAKQMLLYFPGDIASIKNVLMTLVQKMLSGKFFAQAEYFLNLIISIDPNNATAFWQICLMKVGARSEEDVVNQVTLLRDVPEFNKYLTLVDEVRRHQCIELSKKQIAHYKNTRAKLIADLRYLKKQLKMPLLFVVPIIAAFILITVIGLWMYHISLIRSFKFAWEGFASLYVLLIIVTTALKCLVMSPKERFLTHRDIRNIKKELKQMSKIK